MQERPWFEHYGEVPRSLDYEELAVPAFLERAAERWPDGPAILFQNARMTWSELRDDVHRLATAFAALGVGPGKSVAIQTPNLPQTVIAYYAALSTGARVVLTNPLYTEREIEHQWHDAECVLAVVTDFLYADKIRAIRDALPIENYVLASIPEYMRAPLRWLAPFRLKRAQPRLWAPVPDEPGVHAFRKLVRSTPPNPPRHAIDLDEVAVLQYTGGTTGVSKAAMLTHRNLSVNTQQSFAMFTAAEQGKEVVMTCLPLFHVFGMTVCMNWGVYCGGALVLVPNPRDVDALVQAIVKHRVTFFPAVPALFNALNDYPGISDLDVSCIKTCLSGSAPLSEDVLRRFEALTSSRITEGFGMTETSPVTHANPLAGLRKVGTVGIPLPDTDAKIVDAETGERELPTGEEGELVVAGPQVMKGYWKRPDETAGALRDGWMYTGDLASVDADGYFKIVGRKKDMINCNGLKVFPDEVDAVLMAHDAILEAATIGVPDPKHIETVKSFVVLKPGKTLGAADVRAWARESLASYKVPREVEFLDELPKSTVLKVLRRELREREIAKRGGV